MSIATKRQPVDPRASLRAVIAARNAAAAALREAKAAHASGLEETSRLRKLEAALNPPPSSEQPWSENPAPVETRGKIESVRRAAVGCQGESDCGQASCRCGA